MVSRIDCLGVGETENGFDVGMDVDAVAVVDVEDVGSSAGDLGVKPASSVGMIVGDLLVAGLVAHAEPCDNSDAVEGNLLLHSPNT